MNFLYKLEYTGTSQSMKQINTTIQTPTKPVLIGRQPLNHVQ